MKVTRTEDRVSITELLGEYVDAVNQKDYERLRTVFTPDALVDVAPAATYRGIDEIVVGLGNQIEVWPGLIQVVHSGTVRFAADDESSASGRWYISEFGVMPDGTEVYFSGTYHDEYECDGAGEWRFTERRYRGRFARRGTEVAIRPFPTDLPEPRA